MSSYKIFIFHPHLRSMLLMARIAIRKRIYYLKLKLSLKGLFYM